MSNLKDTWTDGIEYILEEMRLNSIAISEYHKERYYYQKGFLKYFRIPTIIFSALNSVFSVGLQPYCPQPTISIICCIISMICGIISSIELFLSIQRTMENELLASKEFYLLSVDIFKILYLERETRMVNGKIYLDEKYQTYCKLIENTNLVKKSMPNLITGPKSNKREGIFRNIGDISPNNFKLSMKNLMIPRNNISEEFDIEIGSKTYDTIINKDKIIAEEKEEAETKELDTKELDNKEVETNEIETKEPETKEVELDTNNKPKRKYTKNKINNLNN